MKVLPSVFLIAALAPIPIYALDCPRMPEQARKDVQVEVKAAVGKIGPLRGAELETATKAVTQDLMGKLPQADKVYLEQMMYASYCSALRDDKTISETEKANRIRAYNIEVRRTMQGPPDKSPQKSGERQGALTPLEARNELAKLSLPYSPEGFVERADEGDVLAVKLYLAAGMDPNVGAAPPDLPPATALMNAAENGDVAMVKVLLAAHSDVNKKIGLSPGALGLAATEGQLEAMRLLLDKGATAQSISEAFIEAARHGQIESLRLLIKRGVDLKKAGPAALEVAVSFRAGAEQVMAETVNLLLDLGVDANLRTKGGKTFLQAAAYDGYPVVVKALADRGADVNARDKDGATALWWTAGIGRRDAAAVLIERGADVNAKANDGTTPLSRAKYNNDKQMIALLLSHGAE